MSVVNKIEHRKMDKTDDDATAIVSSPDERRVAPIRVVNLASLQDIKVVSKEMPAVRQSRRKSMHQVRSNSEDQMEFIESQIDLNNDTSGSSSPKASSSSSNSVTITRKSLPTQLHHTTNISNIKRTIANKLNSSGGGVGGSGGGSGRISKESRPNSDLMKRVALLRVCAEYMLNELEIKNVSFGENQSLEMLKAQYMRETRDEKSGAVS